MNCPICDGRLKGTKDDKLLECEKCGCLVKNPPNTDWVIPGTPS